MKAAGFYRQPFWYPEQALKMTYEKWGNEIEAKSVLTEKYMQEGMAQEEASQKAMLDWRTRTNDCGSAG